MTCKRKKEEASIYPRSRCGGDSRQWRGGQILHDPEVLQGYLHTRLQKDHWRGLSGKRNRVSIHIYIITYTMQHCARLLSSLSHFDNSLCTAAVQRVRLTRAFTVEGEDVRLMLWDTAGQEEFDAITAAYYRGAHACVLAFSATDRDSFEAIPSWKIKVENECGEIPTVLVQNKMDLIEQCVIDPDEAERLSRALGCKLLRTSVKEDVGVMGVFRHLASRCLYEMRRYEEEDDFRIYSSGPRSGSVITRMACSTCISMRSSMVMRWSLGLPPKSSMLSIMCGSVHGGRKYYACDRCEKKFGRKSDLLTHQRTVHEGRKDFACGKCEKKFGHKITLLLHQKTVHDGRKDYACDRCEKEFGQKSKLNDHQKIVHEGRKDFACDKCEKKFGQKSTLLLHQRTVHGGRKDFACDKCEKKFGQKSSLFSHQKTVHEGRKDYACDKLTRMMSTSNNVSNESFRGGSVVGESDDCELKHVDDFNQKQLQNLKKVRVKTGWTNWFKKGRHHHLDQLYPLISDWRGQLPNLREIFPKKKTEFLLMESINYMAKKVHDNRGQLFIEFVTRSGYKDMGSDINIAGKISRRRRTPLHHVAELLGRSRTCVWAAIVVSSLISSLVLMHIAWTYNAAHSTLTVIETTHHGIWNYPFPAVTICNNNQISRDKARNFLKQDCSELLKSCKWKGNVTPCRELFQETLSRDGHCCSFNYFGPNAQPKIGGPTEPRRLTACGYQTGLEVLVDARPRDYWASLQASYGVKVMLHDPHDYPVRSSPFKLVGLGVQEFLDVSPERTYSTPQVRSLPVGVRDCIFNDEPVGSAALRQLELEHVWNRYSYVNCLNSCRAKIVLDNCGCVPHYLPKNAIYDSSWPGKIVEQLDFKIEERPCGCMLDCSNYRYPVDSTEGILDQSQNVDERTKLSLINVFFTDLVSIQYRRYVYYDWKALFASFGGLLGLFVGFSLITGFELVYFFVIRVLADKCKKSRAKKRRSSEAISAVGDR
ncbi:unnamed protein product [Trichogramma brassicae]|uniref:C2H2-type domain-containing protein n=1 Tax=Trichogramma brassicae TaxID=86971 RepID=A0A6H5IRF8_9HYME|nr:unnamed protein product [Trichogramma brassicae]